MWPSLSWVLMSHVRCFWGLPSGQPVKVPVVSFTEFVASVSAEMCGHKSESAEVSLRDISVDGGQIMDQIQSICQLKKRKIQQECRCFPRLLYLPLLDSFSTKHSCSLRIRRPKFGTSQQCFESISLLWWLLNVLSRFGIDYATADPSHLTSLCFLVMGEKTTTTTKHREPQTFSWKDSITARLSPLVCSPLLGYN